MLMDRINFPYIWFVPTADREVCGCRSLNTPVSQVIGNLGGAFQHGPHSGRVAGNSALHRSAGARKGQGVKGTLETSALQALSGWTEKQVKRNVPLKEKCLLPSSCTALPTGPAYHLRWQRWLAAHQARRRPRELPDPALSAAAWCLCA